MAERRIDWTRREATRIQGGLTFVRAHLGDVPEDGEWWRSPFPFKASTKAAYQAVRTLKRQYGQTFDFKVTKSDGFDSVWVRRK